MSVDSTQIFGSSPAVVSFEAGYTLGQLYFKLQRDHELTLPIRCRIRNSRPASE